MVRSGWGRSAARVGRIGKTAERGGIQIACLRTAVWVVVKIMVPFWVSYILGAVLYDGPKKTQF